MTDNTDYHQDRDSARRARHFKYSPANADTYYLEFLGVGDVIQHESRDTIDDPTNVQRVEITDQYQKGFSLEKFITVPNAMQDISWTIAILIFVFIFHLDVGSLVFSKNVPFETLDSILLITMAIVTFLMIIDALNQVVRVYHLRAIGETRAFNESD